MAEGNTYMGVYLKVIDKSAYFTTEPDASNFPVVSVGKFERGEVGVPITFNRNQLTEILRIIGMPVKGKNDKDWWSFYRSFQYSKPVVAYRVINTGTFKNAGVALSKSTGNITHPWLGVDGGSHTMTANGQPVVSELVSNMLIQNSQIATILIENNVTLLANNIGKIFYKYPGVNSENIQVIVLNEDSLVNDTVTIPNQTYNAVIEATLNIINGVIESASISTGSEGTGYVDNEVVTITGGSGSGATARVSASGGAITGVTILTGGSGYTNGGTVSFVSSGSGSSGQGTITVKNGVINGLTVSNGGYGYTNVTLDYHITTSTGSNAVLSLTIVGGILTGAVITNGGSGYTTSDTISFTVTQDVVFNIFDYNGDGVNDYSYVPDLFDYQLQASDSALVVLVDGVVTERYVFNGDSTSDYYWEKINNSSDYIYVKFNNDVLNDTSTAGYQQTPYAAEYDFSGKGEGTFDDVTLADYISTLDYIVDNGTPNIIVHDGAIPAIDSLNGVPLTTNNIKAFQTKLVTEVAGHDDIRGNAILSFPQSVDKSLVGKFSLTDSDLQPYVDYKNGLGLNGANGEPATIYAPSLQRVFDFFNNQYLWIPVSVDVAGTIAALKDNYQYSNIESRRGQLSSEKLITDIKKKSIEGFLYKNGVNPIINRDGVYIVKGHKTLTTLNTAFNRMNVWRSIQIISIQARDLGNQFVGELGLPETRLEVLDVYNSFITRLKNAGKVVDMKVVCDSTNNSDQDLDNNQLNIDLYIKPVKLYDFIHINVTVLPQGATLG